MDRPRIGRTRTRPDAEGIIHRDLARFEVAIRAWAAHEPGIARLVRKVDRRRLAFIREQIEGLGFRGADLDMRARTFMAYYSLELSIVRQSKQLRLEEMERRLELLCRA